VCVLGGGGEERPSQFLIWLVVLSAYQQRCEAPVRRRVKNWCDAEITSLAPFLATSSSQKERVCCSPWPEKWP
jgi:hypothetical protein